MIYVAHDVKFSVCYTNNIFNCSKLAITRLNIENEIMIDRREDEIIISRNKF